MGECFNCGGVFDYLEDDTSACGECQQELADQYQAEKPGDWWYDANVVPQEPDWG